LQFRSSHRQTPVGVRDDEASYEEESALESLIQRCAATIAFAFCCGITMLILPAIIWIEPTLKGLKRGLNTELYVRLST
jgi:hypothetical protein